MRNGESSEPLNTEHYMHNDFRAVYFFLFRKELVDLKRQKRAWKRESSTHSAEPRRIFCMTGSKT